MDFRKLFVESPGNEDSITETAKVHQALQAVFFFFFFFIFAVFFFCQKADPQASETKKRSRSYIPVVHLHSKLALATTCTLRVLSQERHLTVHRTHCDVVRWYERDNDLGRHGEITTKLRFLMFDV